MPEMPSEHRMKEALSKAFAKGFAAGAFAFYGTRHNAAAPVEVKKLYIKHEWDKLARAGALHPDYVSVPVDSTSSEEVD